MSTQELLEAEAANIKPIEEEIEDERRKVEAKTPITEEVGCSSFLCMLTYWTRGLSVVIHTQGNNASMTSEDNQRPVH